MKAYVLVTGAACALLFAAHVARIASEGWHIATELTFVSSSVASLSICLWAGFLYRRLSRSS